MHFYPLLRVYLNNVLFLSLLYIYNDLMTPFLRVFIQTPSENIHVSYVKWHISVSSRKNSATFLHELYTMSRVNDRRWFSLARLVAPQKASGVPE